MLSGRKGQKDILQPDEEVFKFLVGYYLFDRSVEEFLMTTKKGEIFSLHF